MTNEEPLIRLPVHDFGTLQGLTSWINKHDEGIAELFKNVRAAYQENRADVKPQDRVAVIFIKDSDKEDPARIGVLDVGGLTFEDIEKWSMWQDPEASSRGRKKDEETQGNGGKAYMYKLFSGPTSIWGIKDDKKNGAEFIGKRGSLERGIPKFITTHREIWQPRDVLNPTEEEKDIKINDWKECLVDNLFSLYNASWADLPKEVKKALENRKSFTLVTGDNPIDWAEGKANIKNLVKQIIRHPQTQRSIQEVNFYVIHNGKLLFKDSLELEKIDPYPKFEKPIEYDIPEII